jgi:hypothetical protein
MSHAHTRAPARTLYHTPKARISVRESDARGLAVLLFCRLGARGGEFRRRRAARVARAGSF